MKTNTDCKLKQTVVSVFSVALAIVMNCSPVLAAGLGRAAGISPAIPAIPGTVRAPSPDQLLHPGLIARLRNQAAAAADQSIDPSLTMTGGAIGPYVAERVLGQANFMANFGAYPPVSFTPAGVAIDRSVIPNRIYVADAINNRILGWNDVSALVNGGKADLVLGQPDFFSNSANNGTMFGDVNGVGPDSLFLGAPITFFGREIPLDSSVSNIAVDGVGNVYVADTGNNRVLEYNRPFSGCPSLPCVGPAASVVFGKGSGMGASGGSFYTNLGSIGPTTLHTPAGVGVDSNGNLFVADNFNNRVLEYDSPVTNPASPNVTANRVYGQGPDGNQFLSGSPATSPDGTIRAVGGCVRFEQ